MVRCRLSELNRSICLPGLVYLLKLKEKEEESIGIAGISPPKNNRRESM